MNFNRLELKDRIKNKLMNNSYTIYEVEKDISSEQESLRSQKRSFKSSTVNLAEINTRGSSEPREHKKRCMDCAKNRLAMMEMQKNYDFFKEKISSTEKHLKQYDSLLSIKEKRLIEKENTLKLEKSSLLSEIQTFKQQQIEYENQLQKKYDILHQEKESAKERKTQLDLKYDTILKLVKEYETNIESLKKKIKSDVFIEYKEKEAYFNRKEEEIDMKNKAFAEEVRDKEKEFQECEKILRKTHENLCIKEENLFIEKQELETFKCYLYKHKEDIENNIKERIAEIEKKEQWIYEEKAELEMKNMKINEEYARIKSLNEEIKIKSQQVTGRSMEIKERLERENEEYREELENKDRKLMEKEEQIQEIVRKLKEEEKKIQGYWNSAGDIEKTVEELEYYKSRVLDFEMKYKNPDSKQENDEKVVEILNVLESKLQMLTEREIELNKLEIELRHDKNEVNKAVALISFMNEELSQEKKAQKIQQNEISKTKEKIQRIIQKQNEKEKLIEIQNQELSLLKQKLKEREKLLEVKEKTFNSFEGQILNS
ncbi:hypothetical protein SteCoe_19379 [Stentor coeruleus]|uniref:Uncharacterized protein n=1 Tax=Stentor coeruleus TaxID=5963 RepID=A0A1R2BUF0_9CILI|nr:hypothetical protein SteCoe_19379 [Stentor coeruleus]